MIETLASQLKEKYESLSEIFSPVVFKLCSRANKVYVSSAHAVLLSCIECTQGLASLIPTLVEARKNPSKTLRIVASDCLLKILETNSAAKLDHYIDKIEESIKHNIVDSLVEVRDLARHSFEVYKEKFDARLER